jgi:hypothetical protein
VGCKLLVSDSYCLWPFLLRFYRAPCLRRIGPCMAAVFILKRLDNLKTPSTCIRSRKRLLRYWEVSWLLACLLPFAVPRAVSPLGCAQVPTGQRSQVSAYWCIKWVRNRQGATVQAAANDRTLWYVVVCTEFYSSKLRDQCSDMHALRLLPMALELSSRGGDRTAILVRCTASSSRPNAVVKPPERRRFIANFVTSHLK